MWTNVNQRICWNLRFNSIISAKFKFQSRSTYFYVEVHRNHCWRRSLLANHLAKRNVYYHIFIQRFIPLAYQAPEFIQLRHSPPPLPQIISCRRRRLRTSLGILGPWVKGVVSVVCIFIICCTVRCGWKSHIFTTIWVIEVFQRMKNQGFGWNTKLWLH